MYKKALIVVAALWLLTVVAVLAAPATHTPGGMTHFEFLVAVLNDAHGRGAVDDSTSDTLSTWFVENAIVPSTGETPQQARTRIAGGPGYTPIPTPIPTITPILSPTATPTPAPPNDRPALVAPFNATGGANWTTKTNWLTNAPIGEWHGVTTDGAGRVTGLKLHSNGLAGRLPSEIGDMDRMTELVLWDNRIFGIVPSQVGSLTRLTSLWLSSNQFTGALPFSMSDLTRLTQLRLSGGNRFTGCVPYGLSGVADNDLAQLRLPNCAPLTPIPTPTLTPTPTSTPTPTPTPAPPGNIASLAVVHNDSSLWISWTAAARATRYQVDYYRSNYDNQNAWRTAAASHVGTTYTLTNTESFYDYYVRVQAINASGRSGWKESHLAVYYQP